MKPPTPTPQELSPADLDGLIPTFVATRDDIAAAERFNIESAHAWAFGTRRTATPERLLTVRFSDRVHRRMFGDVWRWAGRHRTEPRPGGASPGRIAVRLETLLVETLALHADPMLDRAVIAHHLHEGLGRLKAYPDGNARHASFMAELYLHVAGEGRGRAARRRYAEPGDALRAAVPPDRPHRLEDTLDRATRRR